MKKILLASCAVLHCILPQQAFSKDLKWSDVITIKGSGATNCGKDRITNEAWDKCESWAKGEKGAVVKDVEIYNIATETDKGTSWDPKLNCAFHANVKCGYAIEGAPQLKLSGRLKPADAAAGCDVPPPGENGELIIGQCADNAADKKTPPPPPKPAVVKKPAAAIAAVKSAEAAPPQVKKTEVAAAKPSPQSRAAIQRSNLLRIKGSNLPACGIDQISSEVWQKCEIWAAKKTEASGRLLIRNVELHKFALKTQTEAGCSYEATIKCLHTTQGTPAAAAASKTVKQSVSQRRKAPQKKADSQEFVDSSGMRWSPLLDISGEGVTNCGENRIKNEAWDICEEWAAKKKPSGQLRPTLKDVELYNIASENHQGPSWAPKQSCTFHATLKCGYKME
jgi:hypothetical protein